MINETNLKTLELYLLDNLGKLDVSKIPSNIWAVLSELIYLNKNKKGWDNLKQKFPQIVHISLLAYPLIK